MPRFTVNLDGSLTVEGTIDDALKLAEQLAKRSEKLAHVAEEFVADANGHSNGSDDLETLLHAGGYKNIKVPLRAIYGAMLEAPSKLWTSQALAKRLRLDRASVTAILGRLARRKVIERVGLGTYRIK